MKKVSKNSKIAKRECDLMWCFVPNKNKEYPEEKSITLLKIIFKKSLKLKLVIYKN